VLIYFDLAARRAILEEIHGTLFRGGSLLLGSTEIGLPLGDRFRRQPAGSATFYIAQ